MMLELFPFKVNQDGDKQNGNQVGDCLQDDILMGESDFGCKCRFSKACGIFIVGLTENRG